MLSFIIIAVNSRIFPSSNFGLFGIIAISVGDTVIDNVLNIVWHIALLTIMLAVPSECAVNIPVVAFIVPTVVLSTFHTTAWLAPLIGCTIASKSTDSNIFISDREGIISISVGLTSFILNVPFIILISVDKFPSLELTNLWIVRFNWLVSLAFPIAFNEIVVSITLPFKEGLFSPEDAI